MQFSFLSAALLFAVGTVSAPTALPADGNVIVTRQSATTCGSYQYTAARVRAALNQGVMYYNNGQQVGDNDYPHTFNNREGFNFAVSGPYQEFPILQNGNVYTGGSPGADRVVFNTNGAYAGAITHTGASGNNFVGCSGTSL
ncbi:Guanyl-specific Ribonuclease [Sphaerulina musiva]